MLRASTIVLMFLLVPAQVRAEARCDGIEIVVGQDERRCPKPGAGKTESFRDCPTCPEMVIARKLHDGFAAKRGGAL
jgi:hypothetical protein